MNLHNSWYKCHRNRLLCLGLGGRARIGSRPPAAGGTGRHAGYNIHSADIIPWHDLLRNRN